MGNQTQADASGISANGKGTGSDARIDLSQTTGGTAADGNKTWSEHVGLAHELGHARTIDQGVQSCDKGNGAPGTTPPSEIHSMANENMVRREHNLPIRPSYYDPIPKKRPLSSPATSS
ncbi:M91 family zinc metallopeptidase [Rhodanobacter geophilus]|uniref:M91 family zinc metallopeptidase n=1 Tax=Rhodanobacter geophilus TaxID=3162488 RepID=A0ABV3QKC6_9GAMM